MQRFVFAIVCLFALFANSGSETRAQVEAPVWPDYPEVEKRATGEWWKLKPNKRFKMNLDVPRDKVVAFAVYTHARGTLKLSAQLFPLKPGESRDVILEFADGDTAWKQVATEKVIEPGWSAHFRICLLYTSPSPRDATLSRMPSSA